MLSLVMRDEGSVKHPYVPRRSWGIPFVSHATRGEVGMRGTRLNTEAEGKMGKQTFLSEPMEVRNLPGRWRLVHTGETTQGHWYYCPYFLVQRFSGCSAHKNPDRFIGSLPDILIQEVWVGPENPRLWHAPRWCSCCWSTDHTSRFYSSQWA